MEVLLISGINFMNIVDFFGIYVLLILFISENKKPDKFFEAKKLKHQKITSSSPTITLFCYLKYDCNIYLILNSNFFYNQFKKNYIVNIYKKYFFSPWRRVSENHTLQNISLGPFGDFVSFSYLYIFGLLCENLKVYSDN